MDPKFVSSLMANNDSARSHALSLSAEVKRLKKREVELCARVQELLGDVRPTLEKYSEDSLVKTSNFLEWLLMFRMEADEKTNSEDHEEGTNPPPIVDPRSEKYVSSENSVSDSEKLQISRILEELRMLSRLKRKEKVAWLEGSRDLVSEEALAVWETTHKLTLPPQLRYLYQIIGASSSLFSSPPPPDIYTYSPFLCLVPLSHLGWTEVVQEEHENVLDDEKAAAILEYFSAGHEFEDEYVCKQLCGEEDLNNKRIQVLLIGAPFDTNRKVNSRMFLNIHRNDGDDTFRGDGLLYRLDATMEGDSELVKIGTVLDWVLSSFWAEVDLRLDRGDPSSLVANRYGAMLDARKRSKQNDEEL